MTAKTTYENLELMTIEEWTAKVHTLAVRKGWHEGEPPTPLEILGLLMLQVTELAESAEFVREKDFVPNFVYYVSDGRASEGPKGTRVPYERWTQLRSSSERPKPEGFGTELGDAAIRIMDVCGKLGVDLAARMREKHEYNETRPHRHGGKAA